MPACLYEVAGVTHQVIVPNFVMNMGPGAAAGGSHPSDCGTLIDLHAHPNANRGKMTVTRMEAHAVINFHHVAVTAAIARKNHDTGSRCPHFRTPRPGEIHSRMKCVTAGKGI